ncbi:putative alcohol dehydrogenase [Boeremia exigua]|uniref:putative alcohol dehydrogenase n=1 Tax=Boeremia exigua TaxID=749465 RepID=UPI001E8CED9B|nr:putative alcohol dehydrogenase [Boeremia exigua]KAH6613838.1 putative alcohol dehydrogenase [Boeremia exigua]
MPLLSTLTSQILLLVCSFAILYSLRRPVSMTTQSALIVPEVGGRVIPTSNWPVPQPGPKQVQLRVTVAGLHPHDQKARDTGFFIKDILPAILGNDVAGVVSVVGPGVTKFKVGDRVVSQSRLDGNSQRALQQFAVVDEDFASKIPHGFSDHDAASLPTNAAAALIALFDEVGLGIPAPWSPGAETFNYTGTTLLILGGGSNCGRFGVQLAKLVGIGNIVVVGGSEDELHKYGANHVLDRHGGFDAVLERIRNVVGDDLIYAFDAINLPAEQHLAVSALSSSKKGKLARLRFSVGAIDESKIIGEKKAGYETRNVLGLSHVRFTTAKPFWDRVEGYLAAQSVVPLAYKVVNGLDAQQVNKLLDEYRDGQKVVQTQFRVSK